MQEVSYVWSAANNAFFPKPYLENYIVKGWDLSDVIDVSDDIYHEFTAYYEDKVRGVSEHGMPCWVDAPEIVLPIQF